MTDGEREPTASEPVGDDSITPPSTVGRVLALDVGEKRIGVAVSDPLGLLARALTTVERKSTGLALAALVALVQQEAADTVVVGLPRNMDGTLGPQAERVTRFAQALAARLTVPLVFWDERLSTVSASEILRHQGIKANEQKARIDSVAAAVILEEYLAHRRGEHDQPALLPADAPAPPRTDERRRGRRERG